MIFWSHGKAQRDVAPLEAALDTMISYIASLTSDLPWI
jgi:hypothetical protein